MLPIFSAERVSKEALHPTIQLHNLALAADLAEHGS